MFYLRYNFLQGVIIITMKIDQTEFTVEYQDPYGVVYYRNVKASDFAEAKVMITQIHSDVAIRAVTRVTEGYDGNDIEQQ